MLTNRTNIDSKAATAAWQPRAGMRATALSAFCLSSLPTYIIVGGFVQRHGQTIEDLKSLNRRQNQF